MGVSTWKKERPQGVKDVRDYTAIMNEIAELMNVTDDPDLIPDILALAAELYALGIEDSIEQAKDTVNEWYEPEVDESRD